MTDSVRKPGTGATDNPYAFGGLWAERELAEEARRTLDASTAIGDEIVVVPVDTVLAGEEAALQAIAEETGAEFHDI
jgi:hypothetical protein